jgi:predicted Rossmann fold nucleotide-binding protein DprA/Smf involved in DNA uptake
VRVGAFLVQHPRDLLATLPLAGLERMGNQPSAGEETARGSGSPPSGRSLPEPAVSVLAAIAAGERVSAEALQERTGTPIPELLAALLELEMGGWVRRHPGPSYARVELW